MEPPETEACDGVAQFWGPEPYGPSYRLQCEGTPPELNWSFTTTVQPVDGGGVGVGAAVGFGVGFGVGAGVGAGVGRGVGWGVGWGVVCGVVCGVGPAVAVGTGVAPRVGVGTAVDVAPAVGEGVVPTVGVGPGEVVGSAGGGVCGGVLESAGGVVEPLAETTIWSAAPTSGTLSDQAWVVSR